ncbi:SRPBCC family protein [Streptomyces sparsogenes]|uniref:SRPBCC family protein n=1 Tax=Streptomyces sparsogenes TaxID=67365 RepID=UPI0033C6C9F7
MALVRIERPSPLPAEEAWRRLTAWERHGALVPFTTVTVRTAPPTGVGTVVVAHTRLGRLRFDDPMEVVAWQPPEGDRPGRCRLEKRGTQMRGWAALEVSPSPGGSSVLWLEEIRPRWLPRGFDPLTRAAGQAVFGRVVTGLLGEPP